MIELNRDDPVLGLMESGEPTAEIAEEDGYQRVHFTPDAKEHFERYLDEEHTLAETDYKPVIDDALRCERIYEAMSDGDELLTLPIAKRDANQYIAYLVNRIWLKNPLFTVTPEEQRQFQMLNPIGPDVPLPNGTTAPASRMMMAWSDDVAKVLERLGEHKLRKRLPFYETLVNVITQMVKGVSPAWVKVAYERRTRVVRQTKLHDLGSGWVVPYGTEDVEVPFGDPHKLLFRNAPDILMPADAMDEQEAPWLSEGLGGMDTMTLRHKISSGEYDIDEADLDEILKAIDDLSDVRRLRDYAKIDGREAKTPRKLHNVREVWPYWPIVGADGEIGIYSLCVHYHRKARKLLKAYINPNQHGLRPFVPFFQRRRPDRFSGGSVVKDVAPFQKVISVALHLQLNNAAQANMVAFLVRSGSAAWNWLSKHKVGPGGLIQVGSANFASEIEPFRLGTDSFRSMGEEINFLNNEASKLTTVTEAERDVPNRTAVGTTELVQDARRQQINMVLEGSRYQWGKVFKLLVQQMQQYDIYGESIPFQDPETRAITMAALRMPIEAIADQFTFMLSASSEDDTKDQKFTRLMQAQKVLRETRQETISTMGPMFSPQAPPAVKKVLRHAILGDEDMAGQMIEQLGVVNRDKYVISEKMLDDVMSEQDAWAAQQAALAAQTPPQPLPPKVTLTAKLTPEEEAHAAAVAGVGAQPAAQPRQQLPAAPPQGALQPAPPAMSAPPMQQQGGPVA